ncbi:DUF3298 and DUF4163 domain-containing protein [Asticcacaulis sp. 201]|uniref:DUF3298 and DUF4163 domain-containing protein n=1 Tax=Asticcacaulis sp. 201 TaxID=3028787 RepID=UPI002916E053|nr:DUF4163 domain-containing protein [Asticcacaulis sp. 201]MDV6332973.1 DUF4163 domain-containing protein [Asticcacaulis sp. 201]
MTNESLRRTVTALALTALAGLTACHKKPKDEQPAASNAPPVVAAPLAFARADTDAQVTLTLPDPIKLYPDLHSRLYNEGQSALTAFMDQAHKDRAQNSADGIIEPGYSHSINWKISAQSPRFVSLYAEESIYQGGAHPNTTFQALLWDKTAHDLIPTAQLFAGGADLKPVNAYVCRQIEAARSKRAREPVTQAATGMPCPKLAESHLILVPSTLAGKIGAIDALYAPDDVAPYAEGPYEIRIPANQLQGLIAPDFADQFGGDPVKDVVLTDPTA